MHLFLNIFNKVWALGVLLQDVGINFDIQHLTQLSMDCRRINPVQRPSMKCVLDRVKDIALKTVSYRVNPGGVLSPKLYVDVPTGPRKS